MHLTKSGIMITKTTITELYHVHFYCCPPYFACNTY